MSLKLLQRYPGRAYSQEVAGPYRLATVAINAKSTSAQLLFDVPSGVDIVVVKVVLRCDAADTITAPAEGGVGVGGTYDNIYESQPFYGLTDVDDSYVFPNGGTGIVVTGGSSIHLQIDTVASGISQTYEADLIGYQVN